MSEGKILIYDDDKSLLRRHSRRLEKVEALKDFDIRPLENQDFKDAFDELIKRRKAALHNKNRRESTVVFDEAKIFIIDFNLVEINVGLNGEEVAYNLLCFSDCEYIIGLNRFHSDRVFDLGLTGNIESYSDINISYRDLENEGLWTGESTGYRPWYWPAVLSYLKQRRKQINEVKNNIDEKISKVLEIPEDVMVCLPNKAGSYSGVDGKRTVQLTFDDFLRKSDLALMPKERRKMELSTRRKAKIAASRLSKWIEGIVMPGQNVLVDAPHLVSRYPSLLKGRKDNLENWNKTAKFTSVSNLGIQQSKIRSSIFKRHWVSRPVWLWPDLSENSKIPEVKEPWKKKDYDFVFAEDASSFFLKKDCRSFVSNVDSPFKIRYIKDFRSKKVNYKPNHLLIRRN